MWRRSLTVAVLALALQSHIPGALAAAPAGSPASDTTLAVATTGRLPGFSGAGLVSYVAERMRDAHLPDWQFQPAAAPALPPDRVEWTFKFNPFAGGAVRQIAPMAELERMFGVHRSITIEARLYLGGEYQTVAFSQATIQGGPHDAALGTAIAKVTVLLLGETGAYRSIDSGRHEPAR
jgi:hypothetical protein